MHEPVDTTEIFLLAQWKCLHCGQTLQAKEPTIEVISTCGAIYQIHWEHDGIYATTIEQIGHAKDTTATIDLGGFHQVDEHTYECETPGYQSELSIERNTHFRNWAAHLYKDLQTDLFMLFLAWGTWVRDPERDEIAELVIKNIFAQYGYDLVWHALRELLLERDIAEEIKSIPDFAERPEKYS